MSTTTPTPPNAVATPNTATPTPTRRKKKNNGEAGILAVLGAIVVIGGGAFALLSRQGQADTPPPKPPPIQASTKEMMDELVTKARHERGPKNAKITIVEFADVECRFCREAYNNVLKTYEARSDIRFVFYHYPFPDIHPYAIPAALALESASRQKKFWPMYDALFAGKEARLRDEELLEAAGKVGLDKARFSADMKKPELLQRIETERATGEGFGVDSTPTFFVRHAGSDIVLKATGEKSLRELVDEPKTAGFFPAKNIGAKPLPTPGN